MAPTAALEGRRGLTGRLLPSTRLAVQMTVAVSVAIVVGDAISGRRFYWATSIIGIVCFAAGMGQIWPNAVVVAAIFSAIVVVSAYLTTPYLKIGGRIYASSPENRQPDT